MFRNIFYDTKKSTIHLWETIKGERLYTSIPFVPYIFVKTKESDITSVEGTPVTKKMFPNYFEYYRFCKESFETFEDRVKPDIQFLAERYYKIPDDEIETPPLSIYSLDIEIHASDGHFPTPAEAKYPVVLISINDISKKKTIVFGEKPYTGDAKDILYVECGDEKTLLRKFFAYMHKYPPDVITGWYIGGFDLPYLINRPKRLWGDDSTIQNSLSPINIVRTWESKKDSSMNVDIAGVTHLDFLDLYKWYSPTNLSSYKLESVSIHELKEGKIDYSEYKDLKTLYYENWNLYVEYNAIDSKRVSQLEQKLKYIQELAQGSSLLTKTPMKYYATQTALVEGAMLVYFRRNMLCAPHFFGGSSSEYQGAFVKTPQVGLHKWVFSIDITSSYPTALITLNMSLETFFGKIINLIGEKDSRRLYEDESKLEWENLIMGHTRNKDFPPFEIIRDSGIVKFEGKKLEQFIEALKRGMLCISPNGVVFSTREPGFIAVVERHMFEKRKEVKSRMNKIIDSLPSLRDKNKEDAENRVAQLNALQMSLKLFLNGLYGTLAVPYSRYFQPYIAEAITSCGRQAFLVGDKYANKILNNPNKELLDIFDEINKTC